MKKFFRCIYKAIEKTIIDDGVEHAGYMAFMLVLALFPFLVFFLSVTSFFGASELGARLIELLIDSSADNITSSIKIRFEELKTVPPTSLLNLAIFGTIWTASSFVEGLRTILNRIFEVNAPPSYIIRRLLSIMQFIFLSAFVAFVMLIFVVIPILIEKLELLHFLNPAELWGYWKYFYIFICLFLCVLCFYTFIPNTDNKVNEMLPGAILTTLSWQVSGYLLSKYIIYYNQLSLVYGSLGSIIVTLLFFYIINFLFIVGAAFNYHLSIYSKPENIILKNENDQ